MTNILENSLVMVALAASIFIPVLIVKQSTKKKKQALLDVKLAKIKSENNVELTRKDCVGNLLLGYSNSRKLLVLNLIDFVYEVVDLEMVKNVKEEITYNGKEVKNVNLQLIFSSGAERHISLYKQYENSEREVPTAKKLVGEWTALLNTTN